MKLIIRIGSLFFVFLINMFFFSLSPILGVAFFVIVMLYLVGDERKKAKSIAVELIKANAPYVKDSESYNNMIRLAKHCSIPLYKINGLVIDKEEAITISRSDLAPKIRSYMDYKKYLDFTQKWELPDLHEIMDPEEYEKIKKYIPLVEVETNRLEEEEKSPDEWKEPSK